MEIVLEKHIMLQCPINHLCIVIPAYLVLLALVALGQVCSFVGNFVMMTGPNGYPTGAPFAHMHVPSAQGIRPSNTAFRAYNSSAYYSSADTTAYDEATYSTLAPYDYVVLAK